SVLGCMHVCTLLIASPPGTRTHPARSSITDAMRRLGPAPLKALFDLVKGPTEVTATQTTTFAGRLVAAIDGTQIAVADTPANRSVFPKAKAGPNGQIGRAHVCTPVTFRSRMPSSA